MRAEAEENKMAEKSMQKMEFSVLGMSCAGCASKIEGALTSVGGVDAASVNFAAKTASISFDPAKTNPLNLIGVVEGMGYKTIGGQATFAIEGMSCAGCAGRIEEGLKKMPGVVDAKVNFATREATVDFAAGAVEREDLRRAIEGIGAYKAIDVEADAAGGDGGQKIDPVKEAEEKEERDRYFRFLFGAAAGVAIMALSMTPLGAVFGAFLPWLLAALSTLVVLYTGAPFLRGALAALKHKSADMNTLVALGSLSAWSFSLIMTFYESVVGKMNGPHYFDAAAMIVTLIMFGRWLESRARSKTSEAIRGLRAFRPEKAAVIRDGQETEVPTSQLRIRDRIVVRPGQRIPTDGVLVEGEGAVDESLLTGETMPVEKNPGCKVTGGSVNVNGSFVFEATAVGEGTALAQIIRMVREAQSGKAPIQQLADRVTSMFVPAVLGIAFVAFLGWLFSGREGALGLAVLHFVSTLVVACPCALGLATPTAILVASGRGARMGILFRGGSALEMLHRVQAALFDKTGTLTVGRPEATDVVLMPSAGGGDEPMDEKRFFQFAASAEKGSEHPLGQAIVRRAKEAGAVFFSPRRFQSAVGFGVEAQVADKAVHVGNADWMKKNGVDTSPAEAEADRLAEEGKTVAWVAVEKQVAGLIGLSDRLKPEAAETVAALKRAGIKVAMITGDRKKAALAAVKEADIDEVLAEVRPDQKVEAVKAWQSRGAVVAMIGDGLNDSPALAQADVGIAMATGTDLAMESSDITLMSDRLMNIPIAMSLGRATLKIIRQNLFWAFIYNIVMIPLAAGALSLQSGAAMSRLPMYAAAAMAFSSLSVVLNSLRLRTIGLEKL